MSKLPDRREVGSPGHVTGLIGASASCCVWYTRPEILLSKLCSLSGLAVLRE